LNPTIADRAKVISVPFLPVAHKGVLCAESHQHIVLMGTSLPRCPRARSSEPSAVLRSKERKPGSLVLNQFLKGETEALNVSWRDVGGVSGPSGLVHVAVSMLILEANC
jgi:hypothetical protein